ncbi:MAG: Thioredoxin, partial [uncultured Nocardioidaceae bacterium]
AHPGPDRRRLREDGAGERHRARRLLGVLVRTVPLLRPDVREGVAEPLRRGLRQGGHRGRAGTCRGGQHHLDPDAHGVPRGGPGVLPARSAPGAGPGAGHRCGPRARHGRGPVADRRAVRPGRRRPALHPGL